MNKRWFKNFCAVCVVLLIWAAVFATAGCGGKGLRIDVETSGDGEDAQKKVHLSTDYQVENGFKMKRVEGGYEVELGSATTKDANAGVMVEMLKMMQMMMGVSPSTGTVLSTTNSFDAGVEHGRRIQTEEFNQRADER